MEAAVSLSDFLWGALMVALLILWGLAVAWSCDDGPKRTGFGETPSPERAEAYHRWRESLRREPTDRRE